MPQTYREAIQKLQRDAEHIYESCGYLRDAATDNEKDHWNNLRGLFQKVYTEFSRLDNGMTIERGKSPLKGTY